MAAKKNPLLLGVLFFCTFGVFSWKYSIIGVNDAVRLAGRSLLILAALTWMCSCLFPKIRSYLFPATIEGPGEDADRALKQRTARMEQQNHHTVKSEAYNETVLKPRREAALRRKHEDFYQMTGQRWKLSRGYILGGEEDLEEIPENNETPNQKATKKRKELEIPNRCPVQADLVKEKKTIVLPDEPSQNEDGVLLDWLHKSGYSPILYALYTSFPRHPLLMEKDLSITEVGITTNTILYVEEKDPSNT